MRDIAIFGAKSIALGVCRAVQELYKEWNVVGFLVSSRENNTDTLAGLKVMELKHFHRRDICVLIATPEDTHTEIVKYLKEQHFHNYVCIDSRREAELMEKYYSCIGKFQSVHTL